MCVCVYSHSFFLHSSLDAPLNRFHLLGIANNAAMNMKVQTQLIFLKRTSQVDTETTVRESPEFSLVPPGPKQAQGMNSWAPAFILLTARELVKA